MSEMGPDADLRGLCLVGPPSVLKIRWSMLADQPALCDAEVLQSELQCQAFGLKSPERSLIQHEMILSTPRIW